MLAEAVRETCTKAKKILLDMSLLEWDLLKKPIPPRDLLQKIQVQQPAVDRVCMAVEGVLSSLEGLSRKSGGNLDADPDNIVVLRGFEQQSATILEQLGQIFDQVSQPSFIDRRAAKNSSTELEKQRYLLERVQRVETASRRGTERTVLQSQVEVMLPAGQKIFAITHDISTRALCLETTVLLDGLEAGMDVSFRLLSDRQKTLFPGKLLRIKGAMLIVTLIPGYEAQFVGIVREEVLKERDKGGVLSLERPDLPAD